LYHKLSVIIILFRSEFIRRGKKDIFKVILEVVVVWYLEADETMRDGQEVVPENPA